MKWDAQLTLSNMDLISPIGTFFSQYSSMYNLTPTSSQSLVQSICTNKLLVNCLHCTKSLGFSFLPQIQISQRSLEVKVKTSTYYITDRHNLSSDHANGIHKIKISQQKLETKFCFVPYQQNSTVGKSRRLFIFCSIQFLQVLVVEELGENILTDRDQQHD